MKDVHARIVENRYISGRMWLMRLEAPEIASRAKGGHFLMLEVSKTYDPMGRRAFAVADVRDGEILLFYDVVGRGTKLMSGMRVGNRVRVFGPLGKGLFSYEGDKHLLIGGGVGLAGLTLFGKELREKGKKVIFVYGARSAEHLGMLDWLRDEGFDYILYTDDGSAGKKGQVVEVLKDFDDSWHVSACGPKPMLRSLVGIAKETGHDLHLSLEGRMACGWGVCLGCVVKDREGHYRRVCYEGPVFKAGEVLV